MLKTIQRHYGVWYMIKRANVKRWRQYSSKSSQQSSLNSVYIPPDSVKTITVRTCVGIYDQLRITRPEWYRKAPSDGFDLTVDYVDTWRKPDKQFKKLIVCVHGGADNYLTFHRQIIHFSPTNVRLVAMNLPDFSHTRQTNYSLWHSTLEKYHFIKDFLHKLNIDNVDCLVTHSMGIMPCSMLWEKPDGILIKSMGIIAPQFMLQNYEKRLYRFGRVVLAMSSDWGTWILNKLKIYQLSFLPFKFSDVNQLLLINCILIDTQTIEDMEKRLIKLANMRLPIFIMYGSDERLISPYAIDKVHEFFQIHRKTFIEKDDETLVPPPFAQFESYVLKNAGHFPHAKYHRVTNRAIEYMLNINDIKSK